MNNNKNNQVTPITSIKLGKNNNSSDSGWTVTKSNNKRNLSTSSSSEPPTSPTTQTTTQKTKNNKNNFISRNRYEVLTQDVNQAENSSTLLAEQIDIDTNVNVQNKPPPPIFVKGVADFLELCTRLIELIGVDNFLFLTHNLTNLTPKDGSLWKATKKLLRYKASNLPLKKSDGSLTTSGLEKAELFKLHLSEIFHPHLDIVDLENTNIVNTTLDTPLQPSPSVKSFSPNEVKYLIHKYPLNKSPGFDIITSEVAKNLPKRAIVHLTHIYNSILRLSYFPLLWQFSNIIMIQKPDKPPDSTSSYRPISLLPFFAKILERLLLKHIAPIIAKNKSS
ncbi:hypothetical protein QTP88_015582 [Uroleucon formosanum]